MNSPQYRLWRKMRIVSESWSFVSGHELVLVASAPRLAGLQAGSFLLGDEVALLLGLPQDAGTFNHGTEPLD